MIRRGLASTVRRTNISYRTAITTRLLLHRLHADIDTGIVDPSETVTDIIILSGCLSRGCRALGIIAHHCLVFIFGCVVLLMVIFHRRETVGRRPIGRQLILAPAAEGRLALERHQIAVPVKRRCRFAARLVRDLGGLVGHLGYRRPRLVRRVSVRIRPIGGHRRARRVHVFLIILILILVTVGVLDSTWTGGQILVRARCLNADGTGARIVLRILRLQGLTLAPKAARPSPKATLFEHVLGGWIDGPVVTLPGPTQALG